MAPQFSDPTQQGARSGDFRGAFTIGPVALDGMERVAARLAAVIEAGDTVAIEGEMGAGKTTFIRSLAKALGAQADAVSPTFALQRVLPLRPNTKLDNAPAELVHYDLYRIDDPGELEGIGFGHENEDSVVVVEWPERCPGLSGRATIRVQILISSCEDRILQIDLPMERQDRFSKDG